MNRKQRRSAARHGQANKDAPGRQPVPAQPASGGVSAALMGLSQGAGAARKLFEHAKSLHGTGQLEQAIANYRKSIELGPGNLEARQMLGQALAAAGRMDAAALELETVIARQPGNKTARQLLNNIYAQLIPNWHFLMIADEARNAAYDRAIGHAVKPGDLVLEIGTGSGLLSMMAARAGAERIVTCEMVGLIARAAKEIIERNAFSERVTVLHKMSTKLQVGVDLPRRADVLISEILDTGLLGEGVIDSIEHARKHLISPAARCIPQAATIRGFLVECPLHWRAKRMSDISGFDLSPFAKLNPYKMMAVTLDDDHFNQLSEIVDIFRFDFTSSLPRKRSEQRRIEIRKSGVCHGMCYWFDLHLDQTVTLRRGPGKTGDHWRNVLFFFDEAVPVGAGTWLDLTAHHDMSSLWFDPAWRR